MTLKPIVFDIVLPASGPDRGGACTISRCSNAVVGEWSPADCVNTLGFGVLVGAEPPKRRSELVASKKEWVYWGVARFSELLDDEPAGWQFVDLADCFVCCRVAIDCRVAIELRTVLDDIWARFIFIALFTVTFSIVFSLITWGISRHSSTESRGLG